MTNSNIPGDDVLKIVLEPLLDDFQYWFTRSCQILENEQLTFMSEQEQADLLLRVNQAQAELNAAKVLFAATDGQVGIDMKMLMPWHQLVTECWNVGMKFHQMGKV